MQPPLRSKPADSPAGGRRWLPTWVVASGLALYWCALLLALHYPWGIIKHRHPTGTDKLVHLAIYGLFAAWVMLLVDRLGTAPRSAVANWWRSGLVVAVAALQGAADEWTQPLTGRTCDLADWIADVAGAILAIVVYRLVSARWRSLHYRAAAARS